jgi:hypothetical protein
MHSCEKTKIRILKGLKVKFAVYITEITHEPLYLDKWSQVQWKTPVLFKLLFCLIKLLNMVMARISEIMLGQKLNNCV